MKATKKVYQEESNIIYDWAGNYCDACWTGYKMDKEIVRVRGNGIGRVIVRDIEPSENIECDAEVCFEK